MRICYRKIDNRIIESQSGDENLQALVDNAVNSGYLADEVIVTTVTEHSGAELLLAQSIADIAAIPITRDQIDVNAFKADNAITALKTMTPNQARVWVNTNVNNLADAKSLLATMAAILCVLARRL